MQTTRTFERTQRDDRLTTGEAAKILDLSVSTLNQWRSVKKEGSPPYLKIGGKVYYTREGLEKWVRDQQVTP